MKKKNIIKGTIKDIDYCYNRLNNKSLKTINDFANDYIPTLQKFRVRRLYERKKVYLRELKQSVKEILIEEIEEIEMRNGYSYIDKINPIGSTTIYFFQLLFECLSIDHSKESAGLILFKELISNDLQKKNLNNSLK